MKLVQGFIDIHAHILPGLDDGPRNLGEAVSLLRMLKEDGVGTVVATPHLAPGFFWPYDPEIMTNKLTELREAAGDAGIKIEILGGAEIYLSPETAILAAKGELPTLGDSNYVLVEFPRNEVPFWSFEVLKKIQKAGYKPIVAHPELNTEVRKDEGLATDLHRMGILLQVDASSIVGRWGESIKNFALSSIIKQEIFLVASDSHSKRRPPEVSLAKGVLDRRLTNERTKALMHLNPKYILSGEC